MSNDIIEEQRGSPLFVMSLGALRPWLQFFQRFYKGRSHHPLRIEVLCEEIAMHGTHAWQRVGLHLPATTRQEKGGCTALIMYDMMDWAAKIEAAYKTHRKQWVEARPLTTEVACWSQPNGGVLVTTVGKAPPFMTPLRPVNDDPERWGVPLDDYAVIAAVDGRGLAHQIQAVSQHYYRGNQHYVRLSGISIEQDEELSVVASDGVVLLHTRQGLAPDRDRDQTRREYYVEVEPLLVAAKLIAAARLPAKAPPVRLLATDRPAKEGRAPLVLSLGKPQARIDLHVKDAEYGRWRPILADAHERAHGKFVLRLNRPALVERARSLIQARMKDRGWRNYHKQKDHTYCPVEATYRAREQALHIEPTFRFQAAPDQGPLAAPQELPEHFKELVVPAQGFLQGEPLAQDRPWPGRLCLWRMCRLLEAFPTDCDFIEMHMRDQGPYKDKSPVLFIAAPGTGPVETTAVQMPLLRNDATRV